MGLSDGERFSGVAQSVATLVGLCQQIPERDQYGYGRLRELSEELWPAFLGGQGNGMYWIFGSSLLNPYVGDTGLVSAILQDLAPSDNGRPETKRGDNYVLDVEDMLSMDYLANDEKVGRILRIFAATEAMVYYLRRYDDKFLDALAPLNKVLARMEGECYTLMRTDQDILRAWMVYHLVQKILSGAWAEDTPVVDWWQKFNIHHDVRLRGSWELETEKLLTVFKRFQFRKVSVHNRVILTLFLAGRRFHYEHQQEATIKYWTEYNQNAAAEDQVDIEKLVGALKLCSAEYTEYKEHEADRGSSRFCNLTRVWESDIPKEERGR
jgi:hypothetical protein